LSPEVLTEAIKDVFEGKQPKYNDEEANTIIQNYIAKLGEAKFAQFKEEGEQFLASNGQRSEVKTTASGLQYEVVSEGSGQKPGATDSVTVHYHGTLIDGTVFDSSVERNAPATFGVNQVIKGWTEALQLMSVGSKYKLFIPQDLGYGANPHPGGAIKPYMALVFEVELLNIG
jgi:FKBP-type peptidyl-prolyl cis-trans isomerase FklB